MRDVLFSTEQKENLFKAARRYYKEIVWINELKDVIQEYINMGGRDQDIHGYDTAQEQIFFDDDFYGLANTGFFFGTELGW